MSGFKAAHCACGLISDIAAALGKPAEDIAIVRDIIDEYSIRLSAGESTGMNGYTKLYGERLSNLDFATSNFDEVRFFVVESIETFKPLCESASVYEPKN